VASPEEEIRAQGVGVIVGGVAILAVALAYTEGPRLLAGAVFAAAVVLGGVLILGRFRWAPEVLAAEFLAAAGYAGWRLSEEGYTPQMAALLALCAFGLVRSYPALRRAIRGRPEATPPQAPDRR
jgi:hypothetical protein